MGAAGYLYKPATRKGPVVIVPNDGPAPTITLANGQTVTAVKGSQRGGAYKGHEGYQWVFPNDILGQAGKLSIGGESIDLQSTNSAYQGSSVGGMAPRGKGSIGSPVSGGGSPVFGGGFGGGQASPMFMDPSGLMYQQMIIPQIPMPNYQPIDPRVYTESMRDINRGTYLENLQLSQAAALGMSQAEAGVMRNFAPQQSQLQQQMASQENRFNMGQIAESNFFNPSQVSAANRFNQSELTNAIESSGLPVREVVKENLDRSRQLAKGFLPTTLEDRAFEMAARSKAGDALVSKGFGTGAFMQNAIDKYTIGERLDLMKTGSADSAAWLNQGIKLLVDSPIKYNPLLSSPLTAKTSQDIRGTPSFSPGAAMQAEQGTLSNLTTMSPVASAQMYEGQQQFGANLENNVNQFNAQMQFSGQSFNIGNNWTQQITQFQGHQNNASNAYQFAQNVANSVNSQYYGQLGAYYQQMGISQGSGVSPSIVNPTVQTTPTTTVFRG
jgi:hypothetical protein